MPYYIVVPLSRPPQDVHAQMIDLTQAQLVRADSVEMAEHEAYDHCVVLDRVHVFPKVNGR